MTSSDKADSLDALSSEDAKIVTLARSARTRARGAVEGAAVRDQDGRTYAAASVALPSLRLSALEVAVAMAASSGVSGLEAAAVVTEAADVDVSVVTDLGGPGVVVYVADASGDVIASVQA